MFDAYEFEALPDAVWLFQSCQMFYFTYFAPIVYNMNHHLKFTVIALHFIACCMNSMAPLNCKKRNYESFLLGVASITASWCWCHYQLYIKLIKNLIKVITFYEQAFRSIADMDLMLILFAVIYLCNFSLALQIILLLDKNRNKILQQNDNLVS